MRSFSFTRGALRRSALAAAVAAGLVAAPAFAQSTSGDIYGTAAPAAGEVIQVQNLDNGQTRQIAVDAQGNFRAPSLPIGHYVVNLVVNGQAEATRKVNVVAGQAVQVNFGGSQANAQAVTGVTVAANSLPPIDVTSTESRSTFTADQLNSLPVPRDEVSVSLLAPSAVQGDGAFGNLASFGGSSVAENSYYVNGFNVTNLYNNLSFSQIPYQAIDQLDVQTGGYGAQYGFSTGGVTSVNTKRGTNQWKGGVSWTTTPNWARANRPTEYQNNGSLYRTYNKNSDTDNVYTAWVGGPLVKDKLFFFGLVQKEQENTTSYPSATSTSPAARSDYSSPFWLVKLDWNINDNNILEYTGFDNTKHTTNDYYTSLYGADNEPSTGDFLGTRKVKTGGQTNIFKYTSYLTDDLTFSAQWGRMKSQNSTYYISNSGVQTKYDGGINSQVGGCPYVLDYRDSVLAGNTPAYNSCWISSTNDIYGGQDERTAWRADIDWHLGDHDIGVGYSDEKWNSDAGQTYAGGALYYYYTGADGQNVVEKDNYRTGGSVKIDQKSFYLEDHWQVTDRFMAYMGIRNDSFENKNGNGETFVKQDNIWQPRLGFSWDVNGDSSLKVFGSAGRYSLPIAANVALRAASASYFTYQTFDYSNVDPVTGTPALGAPTGPLVAVNGEDGSVPNPHSVSDKDLKPYSQDEYILGFKKQIQSDNDFLNGWVVGVKATYRKLRNAIDDTCDWRPFYNYGQSLGLDMGSDQFNPPSGTPGCFIYNPGSALTLNLDLDGSGNVREVTIPGSKLGPKAKRSYQGLVFSAKKSTDKWYVDASYTFAKNYGNTEGLVKSDIGQTDTGTTQDFDYPEIEYGANGYLPNDRRHTFKVYGAYKFTPEWSVGMNLLVQSGRPQSCLGGGEPTYGIPGYSGAYYYCNGHMTKRGDNGRTPWIWTVSPNVIYKPNWAKGLTFTLSALNIFNNVKPTSVYVTGEEARSSGTTTYYNSTYHIAKYYTQPRYFRLQAEYDFSL
ncbi:TonB-dependent receptor [Oleiagrimonas sp. C23AA]|uniref:TonB-dependent receptor n=1 Tax=Oleiagrimonas sp. C23AA TaxID=2719047 RepID=UPI0014234E93|nr:TonB-dependent receptor [Oleiagrimonas sp. C23AA]NII12221.1 TonB-dependent receptor [Oleiagrimonas sp. C23AA]